MKPIFFILCCLFAFGTMQAQDHGYIYGKVLLDIDSSAIYMANVRVFQGEQVVNGAVTDDLGNFKVKALNPGKYKVVISYSGYSEHSLIGVAVTSGQATNLGKILLSNSLGTFEFVWHEGLIDEDGGTIHQLPPNQYSQIPDPTDITGNLQFITPGVQVNPQTREINFRGSRSGANAFYVDGVRVDSPDDIPRFAVSNMKVYAGGIPARYGDFTGGVIVVETKSYFEWEQEQLKLMRRLAETRAPKTEKKEQTAG